MCSAVAAFAIADSRSGIITGTSFTTGASSMGRPIIMMITRTITAAATPSGPITARGASVTSATGTTTGAITGIIAGIDEASSPTSYRNESDRNQSGA
jgi:hypothetical protein